MARRRIFWKLYPSYLFIIFLSVVVVAWYAVNSMADQYLEQLAADLEARARLIDESISCLLAEGDTLAVDPLVKKLGHHSRTRITIVLASGEVIADSENDPHDMENHRDRPEIANAFVRGRGLITRFSSTMGTSMMYVATLSEYDSENPVLIRTAIPVTFIEQVLYDIRVKMIIIGLIVAVFAGLVSWFVSRRLSHPLEQLIKGAARFAAGDLDERLPVSESSREIAALTEAMNEMAVQLNQRINTVTRQRKEQEAILSSMIEGVLAVDNDMRVFNLNSAAAKLLHLEPADALGRTLHEIVRNTTLQKLVTGTIGSKKPDQKELVLTGREEQYVQASSTILHDAVGSEIGAVVVLNDVTRIRKLENVRREFVANVSHELKTPITSIKGFVETLIDGAVDNPDDARRFLETISRQADRLDAIIEDLLSLSRVEQGAEQDKIELSQEKISPVLETAVQSCEAQASAKNIKINLEADSNLSARLNAHLLEQAVINLITNALAHSESGGEITLWAVKTHDSIDIIMTDYGCGIAPENLPRLFERFYRVDKARSREAGGTGLGLAIVKHIVLAHGGQVSVESKIGKGSSFYIHLPLLH